MLLNLSFEDTSPIITYTNPSNPPAGSLLWGASTTTDGCRGLYSDSSFTGTNINKATMALTFNGTGIWIYGANRANHGNYSVSIDTQDFGPLSGYANDSGCTVLSDFKALLFGQAGLPMGAHDVTLTNLPINTSYNWVDVDYITIETEIGDAGGVQVQTSTVDDSSGQFSYSSGWSTSRATGQTSYLDGTLHEANTNQASVIINFEGQAISVFGGVDTPYGPFVAVLDSEEPLSLNAHSYDFFPQTLLYHANSLGEGVHKLTLFNGASSFDVDYANIWSDNSTIPLNPSPGTASGTPDGPGPTGSNKTSGALPTTSTPIGPIVGGVVGGVLFIALVGALLIFWQCRRRNRQIMETSALANSSLQPMRSIPAQHMSIPDHQADAHRKRAPPGIFGHQNTSSSAGLTTLASTISSPWSPVTNSRNTQSARGYPGPTIPSPAQPFILRDDDAWHLSGYPNEEEIGAGNGAETILLPPDYSQATYTTC
ncbi:hypothetical protein DACRYDRAFT_21886 [Dacryopinax primogenitus]|uniref:Peptidase A1 domain-containing protein n=1 Tax=Dacryopinax primogenitus (strain DJM 731) TaxID=1858805 RepID=M5FW66_DACPD|nr:uncharacterized protein DACRYDRAFT_21886 [Dacryopinax primogenitus]EJU02116.1 hypothetical protein DACRYDRAFT_21886 [Dacryopinax primogenitus]